MRIVREKYFMPIMAFLLLTLMSTAVCFAGVSEDEIGIGGITFHSSADYVKSVYGEPDNIATTYDHPLWGGRIDEYLYGDSFRITLQNGRVIRVDSTANNGLATPAGIKVGMDISSVMDVYGTGRYIASQNAYYYRSINDEYLAIKFVVDSNGTVKAIYTGLFD